MYRVDNDIKMNDSKKDNMDIDNNNNNNNNNNNKNEFVATIINKNIHIDKIDNNIKDNTIKKNKKNKKNNNNDNNVNDGNKNDEIKLINKKNINFKKKDIINNNDKNQSDGNVNNDIKAYNDNYIINKVKNKKNLKNYEKIKRDINPSNKIKIKNIKLNSKDYRKKSFDTKITDENLSNIGSRINDKSTLFTVSSNEMDIDDLSSDGLSLSSDGLSFDNDTIILKNTNRSLISTNSNKNQTNKMLITSENTNILVDNKTLVNSSSTLFKREKELVNCDNVTFEPVRLQNNNKSMNNNILKENENIFGKQLTIDTVSLNDRNTNPIKKEEELNSNNDESLKDNQKSLEKGKNNIHDENKYSKNNEEENCIVEQKRNIYSSVINNNDKINSKVESPTKQDKLINNRIKTQTSLFDKIMKNKTTTPINPNPNNTSSIFDKLKNNKSGLLNNKTSPDSQISIIDKKSTTSQNQNFPISDVKMSEKIMTPTFYRIPSYDNKSTIERIKPQSLSRASTIDIKSNDIAVTPLNSISYSFDQKLISYTNNTNINKNEMNQENIKATEEDSKLLNNSLSHDLYNNKNKVDSNINPSIYQSDEQFDKKESQNIGNKKFEDPKDKIFIENFNNDNESCSITSSVGNSIDCSSITADAPYPTLIPSPKENLKNIRMKIDLGFSPSFNINNNKTKNSLNQIKKILYKEAKIKSSVYKRKFGVS